MFDIFGQNKSTVQILYAQKNSNRKYTFTIIFTFNFASLTGEINRIRLGNLGQTYCDSIGGILLHAVEYRRLKLAAAQRIPKSRISQQFLIKSFLCLV